MSRAGQGLEKGRRHRQRPTRPPLRAAFCAGRAPGAPLLPANEALERPMQAGLAGWSAPAATSIGSLNYKDTEPFQTMCVC